MKINLNSGKIKKQIFHLDHSKTKAKESNKRAWRNEHFDEDMVVIHVDDNVDDLTTNIGKIKRMILMIRTPARNI